MGRWLRAIENCNPETPVNKMLTVKRLIDLDDSMAKKPRNRQVEAIAALSTIAEGYY